MDPPLWAAPLTARSISRASVTPTDRRLSLQWWRPGAILVVVLLLTACTQPPPVARPREGAAPSVAGGTPIKLEVIPPPTLSIAGGLIATSTPTPEPPPPSPSPGVLALASPIGSPGLSPIVSGLQPAPGSALPAGDVVISARVSGTADLIDVAAFVDGEEVPVDLGSGSPRVRTVSFVRTFISGTHEVRIQARDEKGQLGGYRWQFSVGAPRLPAVAPAVRPPTATPFTPAFTPIPIPTRRPTSASAPPPPPSPAARPAP